MGRVQDRIALISGAARGMGATHARAIVAEGGKVVIGDLLDEVGEALATELGDAASYVHLDVTREEDWATAVAHAVATFGGLDILINNAGIASGAYVTEFPIDLWRKTLDINLTGTFLGMQAAIPQLSKSTGASIINVSSVEGMRGSPGLHAYVASKFAVRGITKSVALDVASLGIRVNSIHPGFIHTPMTESLDYTALQIPLERAAQPEEVSKLVVFLASDDSSYCTGGEFVIDGGLIAGVPMRGAPHALPR